MLSRRQILQSFGSVSAFAQQRELRRRPNILFLFTDDHAYQAISAYEHPLKLNQTPHIDRIAAEGMIFHRCIVPNSICAPARATILTGQYSHRNGVPDNRSKFDGSKVTFPKLLQREGYQTAIFGKWHLQSDPTGFDAWEVLPGQGSYYNPDFLTPQGKVRREGYATDLITDRGIEWLDSQRDKDKPFCLMLQHKAPHRNWMPAPRHYAKYAKTEFKEPATLFDKYDQRASPSSKQEMEIDRHMRLAEDLKVRLGEDWKFLPEWDRMTRAQQAAWVAAYEPRTQEFRRLQPKDKDLVRWKYQQYLKDYLACIAAVDENVGRMLDYLDRHGLAANTLVVYASDQGFYLGEHGWFDKRWIYEESLRTPFLVRWPQVIKAGMSSNAIVSNLDFAQTFLAAARAAPSPDMQGRSLLPFFENRAPVYWRRSFYYRYTEPGEHNVAPHEGVVTDRYKLVYFWETNEWELFDRVEDPRELRSFYDHPSYARIRKDLEAELIRVRREAGLSNPARRLP